jgi:signal transduction histidine kinase
MQIQDENNLIVYLIIGTALIALFLMFFLAFFAFYKKRVTQKEKQVLQLENDYRFNLIKKTIETQETEKIRLAKDLHDDIGPMLNNLKYAINQIEINSRDKMNIKNAHEVLDKIMVDFRTVYRDLIPASIKNYGLIATLKEVIEITRMNSDIAFQFTSNEFQLNLILEKQLSIYRLFKEVLNNMIKHAKPKQIHIDLHTDNQFLKINFDYDGQGITNDAIQKIKFNTNSIGIQSIDTRLLALGGQINYLKAGPTYSVNIRIPA